MAVIQELSPHLADLIAAGEVVERPASVAKELIENAIDAGATRITVEIENGGVTYLRIADDGCGIAPEDAPIAFRRHATSKLRTEADLAAIGTLGFRGEALAAIAAVARIDLLTKQRGALAGTHLHLEAGTITEHEEAGCPEGTTLVIRDLFFNTPARMKFLKKDFTEAGYVLGAVQHAALSHPEISMTLIRDGKQVFCSAGDGKLMTPVFGVFGRELTGDMLEVEPLMRDNLTVWGYITKPHAGRPTRGMQHFFVNGRYVKNRTMQAALEEAYRNRIITGKYPSCTLFLTMPLGGVDVNVHPAKTEIKFAQEKPVFEVVYIACKNALEKDDNVPEIRKKQVAVKEDNLTLHQQQIEVPVTPLAYEKARQPVQEPPISVSSARPTAAAQMARATHAGAPVARYEPHVACDDFDADAPSALRQNAALHPQIMESARHTMPPVVEAAPAAPVHALPQGTPKTVPLTGGARVLGEAFHTYIVAEDAQGMLLIDKHAAHERMLFNKLRETTEIAQQRLLAPVIVEPSATESAALTEHLDEVRATGFDLEPFGSGSFAVRGAPAYLDSADIPSVLSEIAMRLMTSRAAATERFDDLIHMVACKAAIKAGSSSALPELQSVCDRVLADPEVSSCPHGRPVMVRLTRYELDKLFKRVNQ